MRKVLVAAFETEDQTNEAVTDLKAAGIPSTAIRRYLDGGEGVPARSTTRSEQTSVLPTKRDGRTVIGVTVEEPESRRVKQILQKRGPLELQDTGDAPDAAVGENVATPADRTHPMEETLEGQRRRAEGSNSGTGAGAADRR